MFNHPIASVTLTRIVLSGLCLLSASGWAFGQCPTITIAPQVQNASCGILNDGQIDLQVQGGQAPYTYQWNHGARTSVASDLAQGEYTVVVTDAAGCTATLTQTVESRQKLQITAETTPPSSPGGTDGTIEMTVVGGTGPYTFHIMDYTDTQDIKRFQRRTPQIEGLKAGRYAIDVIDANGCIDTHMVTLDN